MNCNHSVKVNKFSKLLTKLIRTSVKQVLFLCPKAGEISGKGNRKIKCSGRPRLYWISKWH